MNEAAAPAAPPYLTADEVATLLRLSAKSVYRLIAKDASFPATRIGGAVRVRSDRLDRWLADRTQGVARPRLRRLDVAPPRDRDESAVRERAGVRDA